MTEYTRQSCHVCRRAVWKDAEQAEAKRAVLCAACCKHSEPPPICGICYDPCRPVHLGCRHSFCEDCLRTTATVAIEEGRSVLSCPEPGCSRTLAEPLLRTLLPEAAARRLLENQNARTRDWSRSILEGAALARPDAPEVRLVAWARGGHAQLCPRCYVLVEKSDGCHHIQCPCGQHFCFACGKEWDGHQCLAERPRFNSQGLLPESAEAPAAPPSLALAAPHGSSALVDAASARAAVAHALTLKCPRCQRAFAMEDDFADCFCLRCSSCPCMFCAWCLEECPATSGDPHSHVLDCPRAPADMRGHALYLADHNGGPHVPPHPRRKFEQHWAAAQHTALVRLLESIGDETSAAAREVVREAMAAAGERAAAALPERGR